MIRWGWEPLEPGLPTPAVSNTYTWADREQPALLESPSLAGVADFRMAIAPNIGERDASSGDLQYGKMGHAVAGIEAVTAVPAVGGYCPRCVNRFSLPLEAVIRADGRVSCPHCGLSEDPTRTGLAQLARHWAHFRATGQVLPAEVLDVIAAETAQESGGQP